MKEIVFNTLFNIGAKGSKGDRGSSFIVPVDSIVAYDGVTVPEGFIETVDPTGGGGTDEPALLFLFRGRASGNDAAEKVDYTMGGTDTGEHYSEYLYFDTIFGDDTKEFTVLQDFKALILPWTYNYRTALSTTSEGEFYINGSRVAAWDVDYTGERYYRGVPIITQLHQGDKMF